MTAWGLNFLAADRRSNTAPGERSKANEKERRAGQDNNLIGVQMMSH